MLVLIASASLPVFSAFSSGHGGVHRAVVYLGLYLAAVASGSVKPCTWPQFPNLVKS
uniref:Uncharacterized protein n=1 Tax=Arundo donax TaxID=35708 RepID=A0A0A9BF16_ARUDO